MTDRFNELDIWDQKIGKEHYDLIEKHERAVLYWQPMMYLCLRAAVVALPLTGLLLDRITNSGFSWFSASGALITLLGIFTQLYRGYIAGLVAEYQLVSLERAIGNVFYYAYKTKRASIDGKSAEAPDDETYFRSVLQSSWKVRTAHRYLSSRKQLFELLFLLFGTIIWAYGSLV